MRSIAIINQKGGVGKTTTAVNLGAALAACGRRVLLMDIDPQANLTMHLDIDLDGPTGSIYDVLSERAKLADVIVRRAGMDVVPSHIDLAGAEVELVSMVGRETILRERIQELLDGDPAQPGSGRSYDFLIIDCPPSLGLLSLNALTSVNEVMIAMQTEFFALQGMTKLMDVVKLVRNRLNDRLVLTAIVPCRYDPRTNLAKEVLEEMRHYFGKLVTRTRIRANVRLAEAPSHGKTIFEYDAEAKGAVDYRCLAAEVLGVASGEDMEKAPHDAPEAAVGPAGDAVADPPPAVSVNAHQDAAEDEPLPAEVEAWVDPSDEEDLAPPPFEDLPDREPGPTGDVAVSPPRPPEEQRLAEDGSPTGSAPGAVDARARDVDAGDDGPVR